MVLRLKDDDPEPPYPLPWEDAEGVLCACDCELGSKKTLDFLDFYWPSSFSLMYLALSATDTPAQVLIPICFSPSHGIFPQRCLLARVYEPV